MKSKRIIGFLSVVLMVVLLTSVFVFAEEPIAKVNEYLVAPGQYTNHPAYGINIESTLAGKGITSLGNFGGYVIYEFNEPIENSDNHLYGTDFIVSGNAFNAAATTQEPGQVWVSQDGENWFALAGSEHYEDETVWDYSVTYSKSEERKCNFADSLGDYGVVSNAPYPLSENYPTVTIPDNNLTLSGVLLRKQREASIYNGIATSFGYVDTLKNSGNSVPVNPYIANPAENCRDGMFDISWAVDENGVGVALDWIKFVKVQTATFIDGAVYGEKSTEITSVKLADCNEKTVESTSKPDSIIVDGQELDLSSDENYFEVSAGNNFDVKVETDENTNVYINNTFCKEKSFDSKPEKGIIRIIIQSDENSPLIYYINTGKSVERTKITLSETSRQLETGKSFKLSASSSKNENVSWYSSDERIACVDSSGIVTAKAVGTAFISAKTESGAVSSCKIVVTEPKAPVEITVSFSLSMDDKNIQKHSLFVKSDTAEKYGYETATKDHNNIEIEGVTVFDAIVASHEELYGENFNTESKDNYLVMKSGFITKAFGKSTASSGFIVNGVMPNDGIKNPLLNSYTGYSCDTARLNNGDDITFFFYKDTKYWSDYYTWFNSQSYNTSVNKSVTVNLKGYCAMYYGINDWQTILDKYAVQMVNAEVYTYIDGEKTLLGKADKNGNVSVRFSKEGEYVIFAEGNIIDSEGDSCPVIVSYSTVKVEKAQAEKPSKKPTFFDKIKSFFKSIGTFFEKTIKRIFGR